MPEGRYAGQKVKLTKPEKEWLHDIYGSPTRLFILSMARKNGKTSISAFLLLLHLCGPEFKPNSQLYSGAQSRDQAAIVFALAAKIVRMSPDLASVVVIRDTAKQLYCPELGTIYRALSADATTAYGLSPAFNIHDELGQVSGPRSELYEAMETASSAQEEPLSVIISTQAPDSGDLLSMLIDDALTGADPTIKCILYAAEDSADPFSEEAVRAANPHYDYFMNKDEVARQMGAAQRMPSRESSYRNLILNQRVSQRSPLVPRTVWEMAAGSDVGVLSRNPVYIALDLSARNDMTAAIAVAEQDGVWHSEAMFWVPEEGIADRAMRDRAPYDLWAKDGYIQTSPGASIDYAFIAYWLVEYCKHKDVKKIAFDRWRIDVLIKALADIGADTVIEKMEPFGQGYKDMAPAIDQFEADLMNGNIKHPGNPALTWNAANAIAIADPAGNRKLDKAKSSGRIDGMVAFVMARGVAAKTKDDEVAIDEFLNNVLRA